MKTFYISLFLLAFSLFQGLANEDNRLFRDRFIKRTMNRAALWQLDNPKHALYDWTNGAFYAGLFAAYETTGSRKIYRAMMDMGEQTGWKPGRRLHHADDHAICQTYIDLYRIEKDPKMITPFIDTMAMFMITPYSTNDLRRITWWWCDALFMAPPAYIKLGMTLNEKKYLDLNDSLFIECYDLLYDKEEKLYARDIRYKWDEPGIEVRKEANGKKIFWSRGNGWVMGGLVRVLQELPSDYKMRGFYEQNYLEMAKKIASLQQPDGLWRASLLDPDSYPGGEASGSGFFCYALAWGINNGLLDRDEYLPVVKKAWAGLISLIQEDGRVGWVQPIGADPRQNFSAESWEVYGTGAFLLAGSEVIKLD
jgi:unsaturated rhamnogalacturonyl hydrolase